MQLCPSRDGISLAPSPRTERAVRRPARPAGDCGAPQPHARRPGSGLAALRGQWRIRLHRGSHGSADRPTLYEKHMPLCTQSQWGWHTVRQSHRPGRGRFSPDGLRHLRPQGRLPHQFHRARSSCSTGCARTRTGFTWARIGFAVADPIVFLKQTLDLWSGVLHSEFRWKGQPVVVETCCHPTLDLVAVTVRGALPVSFEFPYGSGAMNAADWDHPEKHSTTRRPAPPNRLTRQLDGDRYGVAIAWQNAAAMAAGRSASLCPDAIPLRPLEFVCAFAPQDGGPCRPPRRLWPLAASTGPAFWNSGGAVELPGAPETGTPRGALAISHRHPVRRLAAAAGDRTHVQ